jgi:hypothetical protein
LRPLRDLRHQSHQVLLFADGPGRQRFRVLPVEHHAEGDSRSPSGDDILVRDGVAGQIFREWLPLPRLLLATAVASADLAIVLDLAPHA